MSPDQVLNKDYDPSDFEYVMSALANLKSSIDGIKVDDIYSTIREAENGKQFDAGVSAYIKLIEMVQNERNKKRDA